MGNETRPATVLIPTAGRSHLLEYTLSGLRSQSFKDFEVLLVLRPNDTRTIEIAEDFKKYLDIRIIFQRRTGLIAAYNEGIQSAHGSVITFLDDDSIPNGDLIEEHLSTYDNIKVAGVSGDVIPTYLVNGDLRPLKDSSEILRLYDENEALSLIGRSLWNRPLEGQENYLTYISKAGYSQRNIRVDPKRVNNSLLCMAANMSVLCSTLKDFQIPESFLKRGIAFEQIVGWHLWKSGHRMVFNPKAKVYHVQHGETMSRSLSTNATRQAFIEDQLLFYYLLPREEKLSVMHRIVSVAFNALLHIKKAEDDWKYEMTILKAILLGNLIGLKLSKTRR